MNTAASLIYAVEGQTFVVAPCAVIGEAALEQFCDTGVKRQLLQPGGGFARIYGPRRFPAGRAAARDRRGHPLRRPESGPDRDREARRRSGRSLCAAGRAAAAHQPQPGPGGSGSGPGGTGHGRLPARHAYWDDPARYERWSASARAMWLGDQHVTGDTGFFVESVRPSTARFETLFSNGRLEGIAQLAGTLSGEVAEHAYWGGARDRLPQAQTDPLARHRER